MHVCVYVCMYVCMRSLPHVGQFRALVLRVSEVWHTEQHRQKGIRDVAWLRKIADALHPCCWSVIIDWGLFCFGFAELELQVVKQAFSPEGKQAPPEVKLSFQRLKDVGTSGKSSHLSVGKQTPSKAGSRRDWCSPTLMQEAALGRKIDQKITHKIVISSPIARQKFQIFSNRSGWKIGLLGAETIE